LQEYLIPGAYMKITKSKTGILITHETGVKQTISKEELQIMANDVQSEINDRQAYKLELQNDIDEITTLEVKSQ